MTDHKAKYIEVLQKYIPADSLDTIADWILRFNFNLKITEGRLTKLGDYRSPHRRDRHLITINHNLNKYSFLITLVHEIAHLTTFEKHKVAYRRILPHGSEWKMEYKNLMQYFLKTEIFPEDVLAALNSYMKNPAASSCSDANLLRVLRKYDSKKNTSVHLEDMPVGSTFKYGKDRYFTKGTRIRKRFTCYEVGTKRVYLFSPLAEVHLVAQSLFGES